MKRMRPERSGHTQDPEERVKERVAKGEGTLRPPTGSGGHIDPIEASRRDRRNATPVLAGKGWLRHDQKPGVPFPAVRRCGQRITYDGRLRRDHMAERSYFIEERRPGGRSLRSRLGLILTSQRIVGGSRAYRTAEIRPSLSSLSVLSRHCTVRPKSPEAHTAVPHKSRSGMKNQ